MIKIAIVGSRSYTDYTDFKEQLLDYFIENNIDINFIHLISGGAKGVDTLAENFALDLNIPITVFEADWDRFGKKAGFIRN